MATLPPDDELQQEFRDWFDGGKIRGFGAPELTGRPFYMPAPKIVEYFTASRKIRQVLQRLDPDKNLNAYQSTIVQEYAKVLCILLLIGQGHRIRNFVRHDHLSDAKLPFDDKPANFPLATDGQDFFDRFKEVQWQFCVTPFTYNMDRFYQEPRILPILTKDKIGTGGSSNTFKVTIPQAYDELEPHGESEKKKPSFRHAHTYVLKTYRTSDAKTHYDTETRAFRLVVASGSEQGFVPGLIGFHGNFIHGGMYNVLLEYADQGTLEDYFQNVPPPATEKDIVSFWRGIFAPILALLKIHGLEEHEMDNSAMFQGWHQDIKPQNILVVSNDRASPYEYEFKLADLGLSHFRKRKAGGADDADTDTYGTKVYGAPESYRFDNFVGPTNIRVKKSVDIWSLGCVYSEAATWLVLGKEGVEQYHKDRKHETTGIPDFKDDGCFHNGYVALKSVEDTHDKIGRSKRGTDHITKHVLRHMVHEMLGAEGARPNAYQLWQKSRTALNQAGQSRKSSMWSSSTDSQTHSRASTIQNASPQSRAAGAIPQNQFSSILTFEEANKNMPYATGQFTEDPAPLETHVNHTTVANDGDASLSYPEPRTPARDSMYSHATWKPPNGIQRRKWRNYLSVESAVIWKDEQRQRRIGRSKTAPEGGENFMSQIQRRDHVFVVDDSESMREADWQKVTHKFDLLAYIVKEADPDGLDLYFSTSREKFHSKKTTELRQRVSNRIREPRGQANLRIVLDLILDEFRTSAYAAGHKKAGLLSRLSSSKQKKPMTCYILTDGAWFADEHWNLEPSIREFVHELIKLRALDNDFGIQFISFGNNQQALQHLQYLDSGLMLQRDIIDTEPADQNVWKMLLGSINRAFDSECEPEADDIYSVLHRTSTIRGSGMPSMHFPPDVIAANRSNGA